MQRRIPSVNPDVSVPINLTRPIRTSAEREDLVAWLVAATQLTTEKAWLEWKSTYDLAKAEDQFDLARQILGFANRDPGDAATFLGGCAYLLAGLEPGNLPGIRPVDPADLGKNINQYTGGVAGPRWDADYVSYQGKTVLVVTVEAPAWGDPIHSLRKGFDKWLHGVIFVRRVGQTEQANPQEVIMLQERACRRTTRIAVVVRWKEIPSPILAVGVSEDEVGLWEEHERAELLAAADRVVPPELDALGLAHPFLEKRSPEDYRVEVEAYLAAAAPKMDRRVRAAAVIKSQPLRLVVVNQMDTNFADVRCEVRVDGPVLSFFDPRDAQGDPGQEFPSRPRLFGTLDFPRNMLAGLDRIYTLGFGNPRRYRGHADNSKSSRLVFDPVHLRPLHEVSLEPFIMVAGPELVGHSLRLDWSATATNADSVASGTLELSVDASVFGIANLT